MFETSLSKLLRTQKYAQETDLLFVAKDNEVAHTALNDICKLLMNRIKDLEEFVTTQVTHPANIRYRPDGEEDHLSLKENFDLLYERLNNLEQSRSQNAL